jgi:hypothetical protein
VGRHIKGRPVERHNRKPDPSMLNSREALAELRRREPTFNSEDQLWRTHNAIMPPRRSHISGTEFKYPRFYSARDLDLLLVAHRLRVALTMRYEVLGCLARLARRKQIDEIAMFSELLDQTRLDRAGGDAAAHQPEQMTA